MRNARHKGSLLFVSSGLGGMSGAQPKAARIAGVVGVVAEIDPKATQKRYSQGWVDEVYENLETLSTRIREAKENGEAVSLAYQGNVVDLWEHLERSGISVELGSDQTSLHNPYSGGFILWVISGESADMIAHDPKRFEEAVRGSLIRQVTAINKLAQRGMYFFDYGNAFLLEASRAGADVLDESGKFRYPSYVQDIMGPLFFDYGFGPFRWVCTSSLPEDLRTSDEIAAQVLEELARQAPENIRNQMLDNLHWIQQAEKNNLVVGSHARILYADARDAFVLLWNEPGDPGLVDKNAPIVLGRDHHDVSGTDSPFRETSNIYTGQPYL
jgi:urocanate hydratase